MALDLLRQCPLCGSSQFSQYLTCTDYTATNEDFNLQQCVTCKFILTNPRPDSESLSRYYDSEEYISHSGRSTGLITALYLQARKRTIKWKRKLVSRYKPVGSILDFGCGTGQVLNEFRINGWTISGVEPSPNARQLAANLTGTNIASSTSDLEHRQFDVITMWHVLEHIPNLNSQLAELKSMLNPGGFMLIAVPNNEAADAAHYRQFWAAWDVPRHLWHFTKETMSILLQAHGLRIKEVLPMTLDAYYVSLLSEKYLGHSQPIALLRAFFNGLQSNRKARATTNYSSLIYIATA